MRFRELGQAFTARGRSAEASRQSVQGKARILKYGGRALLTRARGRKGMFFYQAVFVVGLLGFASLAEGEHGPNRPSAPRANLGPTVRPVAAQVTREQMDAFIRTDLSKVLIGGGPSRISTPLTVHQYLFLHDIGLLNDSDKATLRENLARTYKLHRFPSRDLSAEEIEAFINGPRKLPEGMAEMLVAALMKLKELDLQIVPSDSVYLQGGKREYRRTGVMTEKEKTALYGDDMWSDLTESFQERSFNGEKVELNLDFVAALEYVEYGFKYDPQAKSWVPKYPSQSLERAMIIEVDQVIRSIYSKDVNFKQGAAIRKAALEEFDGLVARSQRSRLHPSSVAKDFVESVLRRRN